jgi:hypothetical protein
MVKETLTAKVSPKTLDRLESHADREGISKSEAADRMIKQGLDVEESDMRLVPVRSDGGTIIEKNLTQIDGQLQELDQEIGTVTKEIGTVKEQNKRVQEIVRSLSIGFVAFIVWAVTVLVANLPLLVELLYGGLVVVYISYFMLSLGVVSDD